MTTPKSKIIEIVDVQAGRFTETIIDPDKPIQLSYEPFAWREVETRGGRRIRLSLKEALVQQPDASNMLRADFKFLAFSAYRQMPRTIETFTVPETSDKPEEYYLRDAGLGLIPRTKSGQEAPRLLSSFEGGAVVQNFRYAGAVEVTGDDIRFDRIGKIRQTAALLGRSAAATEESEVYKVITTSANYTRNSTTGDNDVGANTSNNTLTHANFEDALSVIATAKDRKSGIYLGFTPNTIIIGPRLEWMVKKLLTSGGLNFGGDDESERGNLNVYRGALQRIIVSPYFSASYEWAICDANAGGLVHQVVEPFNVLQSTMNPANTDWLLSDKIAWVAAGYFGVGFVDDRAWYYSTSTARPTL